MLSIVSESGTDPPRRRHRVVRVIFAASLALAFFVAALWWVVVPEIVRWRVDALLRDYEPGPRAFSVHTVGLTGLTITDVQLGRTPWLQVRRVDVRYGFSGLLRGRISGIEVHDPTWRIAVRDGRVAWGFTQPPRRSASGLVELPFDALALRNAHVVIDMNGSLITIPTHVTTARDRTGVLHGTIDAARIEIGGEPLGSIHSTFTFDGQVVSLKADGSHFALGGTLHVGRPDVNGSFDVSIPAFDLESSERLGRVVPALQGLYVSGRFQCSGSVEVRKGALHPALVLRGGNVAVARDGWPIAIASASGSVVISSFAPLRIASVQPISITSATTGEVDIHSGEVEFNLDGLSHLQVASAAWSMSDGGRYVASPLTLDPRQPRISTEIGCTNVDLDFWLRLLTDDRADGEGRLQGQFAVDWNPQARPRIQFTGGTLVADPQTGYVRVHDAPALSELLDEADPRFTVDETLRTVKQRIIAALQDLGFTSLQFRFIPDGRDTTLRAELAGKGRQGERAQEFSGLVVNIGHFAATLQDVLSASSAIDRMRDLRQQPRRPSVPPVGAPGPDMP